MNEKMDELLAHLAGIFSPDATAALSMPRPKVNSGRDCVAPAIASAKPAQMPVALLSGPVDGDQAAKALPFEFESSSHVV